MAATWSVVTLDYDTASNRATIAHWEATDRDGEFIGRSYGTVDISEKAADTPYDQLNENQVIAWVKSELGGQEVARIESSVGKQIADQKNPPTGSGRPWDDPEVTNPVEP